MIVFKKNSYHDLSQPPLPTSYIPQPPKPPADARFFVRLSSLTYGELFALLCMSLGVRVLLRLPLRLSPVTVRWLIPLALCLAACNDPPPDTPTAEATRTVSIESVAQRAIARLVEDRIEIDACHEYIKTVHELCTCPGQNKEHDGYRYREYP